MMKNNIDARMPVLMFVNKQKFFPFIVLITIISLLGESYQLKESSNTLNKVNIKKSFNETIVNNKEVIDKKEINKDIKYNNKKEKSIIAKINKEDNTKENKKTNSTTYTDNTDKFETFIKEVEKIENNSIVENTIKEELNIITSISNVNNTINSNNSAVNSINKENIIKLSNTSNTTNININNITEANKENKTGLITTITNILSNIHYTNEKNDNKKFIGNENNLNNTSNETQSTSNKNISLISINDFQYQFREYVYCGSDNEVILAITEDNKLLRTANKGLTWGSVELPSEESGQFKKPE